MAVEELGGPIDILVNNAAAAMYGPVCDFPLKRRRVIFEVNVHAPLDLAQAVVPSMVERGEGWIINVSSATARPIANSTMTVYGASKAALNRLTHGLAAELAGTGIRVNTIEPRAAVMSEGATALIGDALRADQIESIEEMVEAIRRPCRLPCRIHRAKLRQSRPHRRDAAHSARARWHSPITSFELRSTHDKSVQLRGQASRRHRRRDRRRRRAHRGARRARVPST